MGLRCRLCNWWVQTGATGLVRESFGWRAARGADTRSQITARPPSNIVHSVSRYNTTSHDFVGKKEREKEREKERGEKTRKFDYAFDREIKRKRKITRGYFSIFFTIRFNRIFVC